MKKQLSAIDKAVIATAFEALNTKLYSSNLGYFKDPFIKLFTKDKPKKMLPIINRGTWSRVFAFRNII